MTHFTAALELSRSAVCLCVVCAFVCFSVKEMPDAAKLLAQKAMPSPTYACCYCGTRIKEARRVREATFFFFFSCDGSCIPQDTATNKVLQMPISSCELQQQAGRVWSARRQQQLDKKSAGEALSQPEQDQRKQEKNKLGTEKKQETEVTQRPEEMQRRVNAGTKGESKNDMRL
jgi:hypothetical protein